MSHAHISRSPRYGTAVIPAPKPHALGASRPRQRGKLLARQVPPRILSSSHTADSPTGAPCQISLAPAEEVLSSRMPLSVDGRGQDESYSESMHHLPSLLRLVADLPSLLSVQ